MGCGCGGKRASNSNGVPAKGTVIGYYAVLHDGTEKPNISAGEKPFLSSFEARVEANRAGGGTVWPVKQAAR
jgi:hypothetical protein